MLSRSGLPQGRFLFYLQCIIDKKDNILYNINKLTCEGLWLGSRMGVGSNTKNSFAPEVSLFFYVIQYIIWVFF